MPKSNQQSADELAQACAEAMWAGDQCSKSLGIQIIQVSAGSATLTMRVREDMVNGHGICHGGMMFTLADSAFAFACNSYNQFAVAQQCTVTFLSPAHLDDQLTATAQERTTHGRSGIYDVTVRQGETIIAEFRGHSRTIKGQHVPDAETQTND